MMSSGAAHCPMKSAVCFLPDVYKRQVEWRAPGIGTVKSGPVDRKGRMKDGYMELLSIKTAEAPQAAQ